jgi:hypothetical protein
MSTDGESKKVASDRTAYRVEIKYREPTFEAHAGLGPHQYGGTFEVAARDANEAMFLAVHEFRQIQELSSVGWDRVIVSIDAQRVEGAAK